MFKKIAVAAALAVIASSASAQVATKFYVGGDVGSTKIDGFDRETSYGAFVGYNFNTNFAVEGGYRRLADFDVQGADVTLDQRAISIIGSLPLSNGFGVFARVGYNDLKAKASVRGFSGSESTDGALVGVGATYAIAPNISARAEIQRPSDDSTNFSVGVSFGF